MMWKSVLPILLPLVLILLFKWINVYNEYEKAVVYRLGRLLPTPKGPGFFLIFWPIDKAIRTTMWTVVLDVPPQDVITTGQRLGQGQRRRLLPRRRPESRLQLGRELSLRHQPAVADHAALGARPGRPRRAALGARTTWSFRKWAPCRRSSGSRTTSTIQIGQECGMSFANSQDIKKGDLIECFTVEEVKRTL